MEELLVRRELAINFVHYEKEYNSLNCLPDWAAQTLANHESDERKHRYTARELDEAQTQSTNSSIRFRLTGRSIHQMNLLAGFPKRRFG